jgi:hypothetical protein
MSLLASLTILSPPIAKLSVIEPHNSAKTGIAAPIAKAAKEPTMINTTSNEVANLKSLKKGMPFNCY